VIVAKWSAPSLINGDSVLGYVLYVDDGLAGPFRPVFNGTYYPSTYSFMIEGLVCGRLYFVKVAAINVAGEGPTNEQSIWLGVNPTEPLNPRMTRVVPNDYLSIAWDAPLHDGCLTILSYTIIKDGFELHTGLSPSMTQYTDSITVGGAVGTKITYRVKAINYAGESVLSEPLTVTVGYVPNSPTNL